MNETQNNVNNANNANSENSGTWKDSVLGVFIGIGVCILPAPACWLLNKIYAIFVQ